MFLHRIRLVDANINQPMGEKASQLNPLESRTMSYSDSGACFIFHRGDLTLVALDPSVQLYKISQVHVAYMKDIDASMRYSHCFRPAQGLG